MGQRTHTCLNLALSCVFVAALMSLLSSSAQAAAEDPLEPLNRAVFKFNSLADRYLLRPTARLYRAVVPKLAQRGVRNFFSNLGEIRNTVHNGLQAKPYRAMRSVSRFAINTSLGVGGLFDFATYFGVTEAREDLGQTLGVWGVAAGPYLVLPILGPSSLRDGAGIGFDSLLNPLSYSPVADKVRWGALVLYGTQVRADFLGSEDLFVGDTYLLYRESYLSAREYQINDGRILQDKFVIEDSEDSEDSEDTEDTGDFLSETF